MFKDLKENIGAFMERDPAARSGLEIVLCYPGFHALVVYRIAHWLWLRNWRLLARFISHIGKIFTAIEIHPGARIGRRFVIDHGTGIVIGETSEIGDDVTLYHDVTLGGISPSEDSASQVGQKRHPTLGDGAIIGSGAAVLGPITIGSGSRVGANSVVTKSIPANVTAVGMPAKVLMPKDRAEHRKFQAYGTPTDGPDPVVQTIEELRREVRRLSERVKEIEGEDKPKATKRTRASSPKKTKSDTASDSGRKRKTG